MFSLCFRCHLLQDYKIEDVSTGFLVALGTCGIIILLLCLMLIKHSTRKLQRHRKNTSTLYQNGKLNTVNETDTKSNNLNGCVCKCATNENGRRSQIQKEEPILNNIPAAPPPPPLPSGGGSNDIPVAPPPPPLPPGVTIDSSPDAVISANGTPTEQPVTANGLTGDNACKICNGTVEISSPKEEEKDPCHVITPQCEEIEAWRNVMVVSAVFTLIFNIIPHIVSMNHTISEVINHSRFICTFILPTNFTQGTSNAVDLDVDNSALQKKVYNIISICKRPIKKYKG